jgi:hypothetical protein
MKRKWNWPIWVGFVVAVGGSDFHGMIRWVNMTENIAVRARPEQALKAFDELRGD